MPRLPALSGEGMIKILIRKGYTKVRVRGSHVRLYPPDFTTDAKKVTVPLHAVLKPGTLSRIMKDSLLTTDDLHS